MTERIVTYTNDLDEVDSVTTGVGLSDIVRMVRWPESLHFVVMTLAGLLIGGRVTAHGSLGYVYAVVSVLVIFLLYQVAGLLNDVYDLEIDKLSRPDSILVRDAGARRNYIIIAAAISLLALVAGLVLGRFTGWLVAGIVTLSYAYSAPPFRFRRYIWSSLLIGLGSSLAFLFGYFSMYYGPFYPVDAGLPAILTVIVVAFSAGQIIRDLKDAEGDGKDRIRTVFTVFGRERGKRVVSVLLAVGFLAPLLLAHTIYDAVVFTATGLYAVYAFYVRENVRTVIIFSSIVTLYVVARLVGGF